MRHTPSFARKHQSLRNTETVLLIDHRDRQSPVRNGFLKNCVGANQDMDRPIGQPHQCRFAHLALVAPGQDCNVHRQTGQQFLQRGKMLPRQYFGRRQHCPLHPRFYRAEQRHNGHHRLARTDIALQQPEHWPRLPEIALDLADRPRLRVRKRKRQLQAIDQRPVTSNRHRAAPVHCRTDQPHRHLTGKELVISQPVARRLVILVVNDMQRFRPGRPTAGRQQAWLDPFGQHRNMLQHGGRQLPHTPVGQTFGQRIDRFGQTRPARLTDIHNMVGVHHLKFIAVTFELTRNDPLFADRQLLLRPSAVATEKSQRDVIAFGIRAVNFQRGALAAAAALVHNEEPDDNIVAHILDIEPRHCLAIGPACRKMISHILCPLQPETLQRFGKRRPDALHRVHFCK